MDTTLKHWRIERDADGLVWATLDRAGETTNVLTREVLAELAQLLDAWEREAPRGVVFRSGKQSGFIAGADIDEFTGLAATPDPVQAGKALVARGWDLYNRLAAAPYPTLALVRGFCMGGGLELALACKYRVVVDEPGTKLALPEVMLGIVPGWGGMLRLPQLIGAPAALDLMLTGRAVDARRARQLGLADDCVPARVMDNAVRALLRSGRRPRDARDLPLLQRLLLGPLKAMVVGKARAQVAKRARPDHYPAPYAILDMWLRHGGNALAVPDAALTSLAALVRSPTTANLLRVYRLQERLKRFGREQAFEVRHVHVVGAGTMGGDIAAWCAGRGMTVTLQDQSLERIAPAIARAAAGLARKFRRDRRAQQLALERIVPDVGGRGVRQADVVIEAIFEDLDAKRALFAALEPQLKPGAVLATNTSSLRLEDIAAGLAQPSRLVGIHFFNPVARMPLVEVVAGAASDAAAVDKALAFVRRLDKLPLPVKSAPGFLVNAVLAPYLHEAMRCVDEGIAMETVDAAALDFGMPMGPLELADTVGLDVALAAGRQLAGAVEPPRCLAVRVSGGQLGRKTGRGFYVWEHGTPKKAGAAPAPAGLAQRLVTPLVAAAKRLVDDGVVADADLADAGVIFGTGFAPYLGGPLHYARTASEAGTQHIAHGPATPAGASA